MIMSKTPDMEFPWLKCQEEEDNGAASTEPEADVEEPDVRNHGRSKDAELRRDFFSETPFAHSRPLVDMNLARSCEAEGRQILVAHGSKGVMGVPDGLTASSLATFGFSPEDGSVRARAR